MAYLNVKRNGTPLVVHPSDRLNLPGQWVNLVFDYTYADAAGHHDGNDASVCTGPNYYWGRLDLALQDFATNTEIQIRQYEIDSAGNRYDIEEPTEFYTAHKGHPDSADPNPAYPRNMHHWVPLIGFVNEGRKLRLEISQWPEDPNGVDGIVARAQLRLFIKSSI